MERIHARRLLITIVVLALVMALVFATLQGGMPF